MVKIFVGSVLVTFAVSVSAQHSASAATRPRARVLRMRLVVGCSIHDLWILIQGVVERAPETWCDSGEIAERIEHQNNVLRNPANTRTSSGSIGIEDQRRDHTTSERRREVESENCGVFANERTHLLFIFGCGGPICADISYKCQHEIKHLQQL